MELSGNILDYGIAFISGIAVSFTPCVYPVLPITATVIAGANTSGTKLRGFVLSLIYVLGLAVTYCAFGIAAALTGRVFGQLQNDPFIFITVGIALILFALVLFDVIHLPGFALDLKDKGRPRGLWSVFIMGVVSGLVVGPCTAPILGTLLVYVASKQNLLHGVSLLFVFSYGVGGSLILVGTFSGLLSRLPKSGTWMVRIKQICGLILIGISIYLFVKAGELLI